MVTPIFIFAFSEWAYICIYNLGKLERNCKCRFIMAQIPLSEIQFNRFVVSGHIYSDIDRYIMLISKLGMQWDYLRGLIEYTLNPKSGPMGY